MANRKCYKHLEVHIQADFLCHVIRFCYHLVIKEWEGLWRLYFIFNDVVESQHILRRDEVADSLSKRVFLEMLYMSDQFCSFYFLLASFFAFLVLCIFFWMGACCMPPILESLFTFLL